MGIIEVPGGMPESGQPVVLKKDCRLKGDVFERCRQFRETFDEIARQVGMGVDNVAINPVSVLHVVSKLLAELSEEIVKVQLVTADVAACIDRRKPNDPNGNGKAGKVEQDDAG